MATISHYREECPKHGHASAECGESCELVEVEYEVTADVSPYVPAKISGPPENCYPAEGGEVEITEAFMLKQVDGKTVREPVDAYSHFTQRELESINEQLFEAAEDYDDDYEPDDYDDGPPDSFDPPDYDGF